MPLKFKLRNQNAGCLGEMTKDTDIREWKRGWAYFYRTEAGAGRTLKGEWRGCLREAELRGGCAAGSWLPSQAVGPVKVAGKGRGKK